MMEQNAAFDPIKANMLKDRGNALFKMGEYGDAYTAYAMAIDCYPTDPVLYTNRSMAALKLIEKSQSMKNMSPEQANKIYVEIEADCTTALNLDNTWVKAYFRRAIARKALKKHPEAVSDLEAVIKLEPKNVTAEKELQSIKMEIWANAPKRVFKEFRSEPVKPLERHPDWKGDLKRLQIEEVNVEYKDRKAGKQDEQMEFGIEVKIPPAATTAFQFYADWSHLRRYPDKRWTYLRSFDDAEIRKLFKDSMEADVFSDIIDLCHKNFESSHADHGQITSFLEGLTTVGRFEMNCMFLEESEKCKIRRMLDGSPNMMKLWAF